jgi:hypothetical protein
MGLRKEKGQGATVAGWSSKRHCDLVLLTGNSTKQISIQKEATRFNENCYEQVTLCVTMIVPVPCSSYILRHGESKLHI